MDPPMRPSPITPALRNDGRASASLIGELRPARESHDVPEDLSHVVVRELCLARENGCVSNHGCLARRIERREPRGALGNANCSREPDALGNELDDCPVDALDLLAQTGELRLRRLAVALRLRLHAATGRAAPATGSVRPAASANARRVRI